MAQALAGRPLRAAGRRGVQRGCASKAAVRPAAHAARRAKHWHAHGRLRRVRYEGQAPRMLKLNLTDGASLPARRRSPAATRRSAARAHPAHVQQRGPGAQARCTSRAWSTAASPPCSTRSPRAPRRAGAPSRRCSDPASSTVQAWVCERSPPTVQTLALDCASDPVAASAGRARQTGRRRRGAQVAVTDAPVRRGVLLLRAENVAVLGGQARLARCPALTTASGLGLLSSLRHGVHVLVVVIWG